MNRASRRSLTRSEIASVLDWSRSSGQTVTSGGTGGAPFVSPQYLRPLDSTSSKPAKSGSASRPRRSKPEIQLAEALRQANVGWFVEEHRFHATRRWRFDFAWVAQRVAVEVEGGVWSGGRHTRGAGFVADARKYNEAVRLGWRVLRFVPGRNWLEEAVPLITEILGQ